MIKVIVIVSHTIAMKSNNAKAYHARQAATKYRPFEGSATFYRFLHAKMFVYILKQFCNIHKVKVGFHHTCHIVLSWALQAQNNEYTPSSKKATPKS